MSSPDDRSGVGTLAIARAAGAGGAARAELALDELGKIAEAMERRFLDGRLVLSFQEYLELFASRPSRYSRDAARYVVDMFDHYGTRPIARPWGELLRYRVFDLPLEEPVAMGNPVGVPQTPPGAPATDASAAAAAYHHREFPLVGHEDLQAEVYRSLANFVQEGRANRLILMHGPNGSAKSTVAACILRALEHYSTLDEGALYRFHWVFPSRKTVRGSLGFGEDKPRASASAPSYAHLDDHEIDSRLVIELRDHPLFLLPIPERRALVQRLYKEAGEVGSPPDWLMSGKLSHKNQQVFAALQASYKGSLTETLRHVQVERYFISRRYRVGAVTVGPALSVDAGERQITADRSLASLPTALQATTLFEAHGELIEAAGGVLEFSDLLKRPIDAFRYLQLTLETGEVPLTQQTVQTNVVMIGSANEIHLAAFREHPEFPSFRGRFELLRAPYLRSYVDEQAIYDMQIAPFVGRHVAPHATRVAAQFAVLTRMRQPEAKRHADVLAPIVASLTAVEKMELFASGTAPERLEPDAQKVLRAGIRAIYDETAANVEFEGKTGVSPREIRTVLFDAAQSPDHGCLSPFAVLGELELLCRRTSEFDWLKEKPLAGGYHDHRLFREVVRSRLLDTIEDEMRAASGLVDEVRYGELFDRYVTTVSLWTKGEKQRNPHTGAAENPDERFMREIEGLLGVKQKNEEHRRGLISTVAAWAIDHPGQKVDNAAVFPQPMKRLRETFFTQRRKDVALLVRDLVTLLRVEQGAAAADAPADLHEDTRRKAKDALVRLVAMGYCERCALEAASAVLRARFAELVT